jgi:hypothetical protein
MKSWKDFNVMSDNLFLVIVFILYRKGILNDTDIQALEELTSGYNGRSIESVMDFIEERIGG